MVYSIYKKKIYVLIFAFLFLIFLPSCSFQAYNQMITVTNSAVLNEPELPQKPWTGESFTGDIPIPTGGNIFVLTDGQDETYDFYSYTIENFSAEEAKEYVKLLRASGVRKIAYQEYDKGNYPIINFVGEKKDGVGVSFSHCGERGGIVISVKK